MKALIYAGNLGSHINGFTKENYQPIIKIGNKPILEHQIELLYKYQITNIIIVVNYLKEKIIKYFGNGEKFNVKIEYIDENVPLGISGTIQKIEYLLTDDFLVIYGNVMMNMHLDKLIEFHKKNHSVASIVLHSSDNSENNCFIKINENHQVTAFPQIPDLKGGYYRNLVDSGVYILSPTIVNYLKKSKKANLLNDVFPSLINEIEIYGYVTSEFVKYINTPDNLRKVEKAYQSGKITRSNFEYKQKAIFIDRDGVINVERGHFNTPDKLKIFEYVFDAVKKINQSEFLAIVITNQASIAKGITSLSQLAEIFNKLETELRNKGAKLDDLYFCPHHPEKGIPGERPEFKIDCECRKPKPGMLLKAAKEYNIDLKESYIIGDNERDILAGKNAGCHTIGVMTGYGIKKTSVLPDFFFKNLKEAVDFITDIPYECLFSEINNEIFKEKYVIGVGGNSRSGKSNFSSFLKLRFEQKGKKVLHVQLDNWLIPENQRPKNINVFERFRLSDIEKDITSLIMGNKITVNFYPNHPERDTFPIDYIAKDCDIIIVEGVVALSSEKLRQFYHKKIFFQIDKAIISQRIIDYYKWRGKSDKEIKDILVTRKLDEYEIIENNSKFADLIITN